MQNLLLKLKAPVMLLQSISVETGWTNGTLTTVDMHVQQVAIQREDAQILQVEKRMNAKQSKAHLINETKSSTSTN